MAVVVVLLPHIVARRGWSLMAASNPLGSTVCLDVHLLYRRCRSKLPHRGGWGLPWGKGMSVPLPCAGTSLLPTCSRDSKGKQAGSFYSGY